MLGAVVAGAAKLATVAAVAVVANEVWNGIVKPKLVEAGVSLFAEDGADEEAEGSKVPHNPWAEATRG